jgi:hypothetical protein
VKDALGASVHGRVRWRRFAAVVVPATLLGVGIMAGIANGAVPMSLEVSNQKFKISADRLEGDGFVQYGGLATEKGAKPTDAPFKAHPVANAAMARAELYDMCQSVRVQNLPFSLVIRAGREDKHPAVAESLFIQMDNLEGNAEFKNIVIGQDATTLKRAGDFAGSNGDAVGSFGQQSEHVTIRELRQVAWSTTAGKFTLPGLSLGIKVANIQGGEKDPEECFK